VAEWQTRQT